MARPIEPTPQLDEDDSRALLASLDRVASMGEMVRRRKAADAWIKRMMTPKPGATRPPGA